MILIAPCGLVMQKFKCKQTWNVWTMIEHLFTFELQHEWTFDCRVNHSVVRLLFSLRLLLFFEIVSALHMDLKFSAGVDIFLDESCLVMVGNWCEMYLWIEPSPSPPYWGSYVLEIILYFLCRQHWTNWTRDQYMFIIEKFFFFF